MFPDNAAPRLFGPIPFLGRRRRAAQRREVADGVRFDSRLRDRVWLIALVVLALGMRRPEPIDERTAWLPADILWLSTSVYALVGVIRERRAVFALLRSSLPLVLLLCMIAMSTLWSSEPDITIRRVLGLIGTTTIALHFANRLGFRRYVESLAIAIGILAAVSAPIIVFFPGYGKQLLGYEGAWQGIFFEKNQLGQTMALGIVTFACLTTGARGVRRMLLFGGILLAFVLMIGSQSAGAIASSALFVVAFPLWLWVRKTRSLAVVLRTALLIVAAVYAVWSSGFANQLFNALGRDASLTGRTDVWASCFQAIAKKPILGYGYREFWDPDGDAKYFITTNEDGWLADMAHNGFIEVGLDIGVVGEVVLVLLVVSGALKATISFWRGNDRLSAWPFFVMLYILLQNSSDRSYVTQDSIFWITFLAAYWFATDASRRKRTALNGTVPGPARRARGRATSV